MDKPASTLPNSNDGNNSPVTGTIKTLIQNLDTELVQLCNTCKVTKPLQPDSPNDDQKNNYHDSYSKYYDRNSNQIVKPMSLLGSGSISGISARTLSSIYRSRVIDAYKNRRIFTIYGNGNILRRALVVRGWLEKLTPSRFPKLQTLSEDALLQQARKGNQYETVVISKLINHFPAFFIWQRKSFFDSYADVLPFRNRVRRSRDFDFSTKIGLIGCAEQEHWYRLDGFSKMSHPRFYRLSTNSDEFNAFTEDFRRTRCRSLLRYAIESRGLDELLDAEDGSENPIILNFALKQLQQELNENEGICTSEDNDCDYLLNEWEHFLANSKEIIVGNVKIKARPNDIKEYIRNGRKALAKLDDMHADYKWDGCRNLWIMKPGYQCRGIGVTVKSSLDEIIKWAIKNPNSRYIVQKYIERPLLIYKTKFDIRQYMLLVIGESMVRMWLYKDCYFRFSSQHFTVNDLRESIHLTNNAVQKRYRNSGARDARLPRSNMWSLEQFKIYLKSINVPDEVWRNKIFGGFRQNLIAVVLASFEETNFVENSFEVYGCDFMLDEQYNPILIEINSTPDLSPSTEVTARICPMMLKDLVKVIVDLPRDSQASTGLFEMVFEIPYKNKTDFDPHVGLPVNGKAMTLHKRARPANLKSRFFKNLQSDSAKKSDRSSGRGSPLLKNTKQKDSHNSKNASKISEDSKESKNAQNINDAQESKNMKDSKNSRAGRQKVSVRNVSVKNAGQPNKLKNSTKEALALYYTKIK